MNIDAINFQYNITSFNLQSKQKEYFFYLFIFGNFSISNKGLLIFSLTSYYFLGRLGNEEEKKNTRVHMLSSVQVVGHL